MILIDYSAIAISNVITQKLDIDENLIRHMILNSLRMHRAKYREKFGELVLCIDGSKNWRKEVYPQYKHKRKSARKESKMDWNEIFRIMNMIREEIKENFKARFPDYGSYIMHESLHLFPETETEDDPTDQELKAKIKEIQKRDQE